MSVVYLGLGSNLRSPARQLNRAYQALRTLPKTHRVCMAPFYTNPAWGRKGQPTYCNTAVKLITRLPPQQLLQHCQRIEKKQGRLRKVKWGARTLDIDILLYDNLQIKTKNLTIPHPGIAERLFVRIPLSSIRRSGASPDISYSSM